MSTVRPGPRPRNRGNAPEPPAGLPVRWAVIAIVAVAAAAVGFVVGGPLAAITAGATVATAAHSLLA